MKQKTILVRFMLDEMTQQNASRFAIFLEYAITVVLSKFSIETGFLFTMLYCKVETQGLAIVSYFHMFSVAERTIFLCERSEQRNFVRECY